MVALAVIAFFFIFFNPFSMTSDTTQPAAAADSSGTAVGVTQGSSGLVVQDEVVGTGATAKAGDTLSVNYTGKLQTGVVFDTSIGRAPFSFTLGAGQVIPGWDQGLQGMRVGGKRLLIIPPALAYGAAGAGGVIPPEATLIFEVDLLSTGPAQ